MKAGKQQRCACSPTGPQCAMGQCSPSEDALGANGSCPKRCPWGVLWSNGEGSSRAGCCAQLDIIKEKNGDGDGNVGG